MTAWPHNIILASNPNTNAMDCQCDNFFGCSPLNKLSEKQCGFIGHQRARARRRCRTSWCTFESGHVGGGSR